MDEPKATKETWGFVTSGWNTVPTAGKIISTIAPQLNIKANYDLEEQRRNRIIEAAYGRWRRLLHIGILSLTNIKNSDMRFMSLATSLPKKTADNKSAVF